jgi:YD repeat-containing protein
MFTYGAYGRLAGVDALTDSGSRPVRRYAYDKWGQVSSMSDYVEEAPGGAKYLIKSYGYDAFGRVTSMTTAKNTAPNEATESYLYTYDKKSQVTSERIAIAGAGLDVLKTYTYDQLDRLVQTEVSTPAPQEGDALDEVTKDYIARLHLGTPMALIKEWDSGLFPHLKTANGEYLTLKKKTYAYDKVGNRVAETVKRGDEEAREPAGYRMLLEALGEEPEEAVARTSAYDEFNRLLYTDETDESGTGRTNYTYDAVGNQTGESEVKRGAVVSTVTNAYDSASRLLRTAITGPGEAQVSVTENSYNAAGQRTRKTVTQSGKTDITNYYYQDGVVSYTTNASGQKTSHNITGRSGNIIATKRYQDEYADKLYVYGKDDQGSVTSIYGEGGAFITGYD